MKPRMFVASARSGIKFKRRRFADKSALLNALNQSKCVIHANAEKLLAQKAKANNLLKTAREIAGNQVGTNKDILTAYQLVLQANQLLHGELDSTDAIPLLENNLAYSDTHPLCVASLYGCIFLIVREPQTHLCMGTHLFHGVCEGVKEHDISVAIKTFIDFAADHKKPDYQKPLEAYLIGGSDLSFELYKDIFNALLKFNVTIKAAHLTVGSGKFEVRRPSYVSFSPQTLTFSQKYTDYNYSDSHFNRLSLINNAVNDSTSTLSLVAVCKNGMKINNTLLLDEHIYAAMMQGYQTFHARYDDKQFIHVIANLPNDINTYTNLSQLFSQHHLHGLITINDLASMIHCAVIYPMKAAEVNQSFRRSYTERIL